MINYTNVSKILKYVKYAINLILNIYIYILNIYYKIKRNSNILIKKQLLLFFILKFLLKLEFKYYLYLNIIIFNFKK